MIIKALRAKRYDSKFLAKYSRELKLTTFYWFLTLSGIIFKYILSKSLKGKYIYPRIIHNYYLILSMFTQIARRF